MNLSLGLGRLVITAENLDWSEAERFISAMDIAIYAIFETAQVHLKSQQLSVALHVQLKDKTRKEITLPLLSSAGSRIFDGNIDCAGLILHVLKGHILIDASAALANGLFIKLYREHSPQMKLKEIADMLRNDEERVFDVLGLEGTL
jgi:hypothetical protein